MVPRPAFLAILGMLLLNFGLSWWRYDTRPSLAGYDEVLINDAAIGFARFGELRAPAFENTSLGSIYALHPPGYLVLQGLIFRAFGLTPLSLRISSKIAHIAVCVLGLLILRRLWQRGVFSGKASIVVALLWLSDLAGFWIGRQARMDPLEETLALAAAFLLVENPHDRRSPQDKWRWLAAAVLVGSAFSMHASAILLWLPFLLGLWFFRDQLGWAMVVVCAALPIAIVATIWLVAHKEHSLEALALFRTLNSRRVDHGFMFDRWTTFLRTRSLLEVIQVGGPSYWVVLIGWIMAVAQVRVASTNRRRGLRQAGWEWIAFSASCCLGQAICAQFLTSMLAQRIILYLPFALLAVGITLTRVNPRYQRVALGVALLIAAAQFVGMGLYGRSPGNRSPDRFDALNLPATATVASSTELWYYYASRNRPFRIITYEPPEHLDEFDVVILPSDDDMLTRPELLRRPKRYFSDFTGALVICLKPGI
jgi:4-amino-4-deoxy-L-arabinose transferase-like glycosyltransferase